jgi:hypothetical protein
MIVELFPFLEMCYYMSCSCLNDGLLLSLCVKKVMLDTGYSRHNYMKNDITCTFMFSPVILFLSSVYAVFGLQRCLVILC